MSLKCFPLLCFGLVLGLSSSLSSAQSVTVSGRVTTPKGYPPPFLKVVLVDTRNPEYRRQADSIDPSTGAFEITNVQQGSYYVVACAGTRYSPGQVQIDVLPGKVPPADVTLILATNHKRIKASVPNKKGMTVTALAYGCAVATMTTRTVPLYFEQLPVPPEKYQFEAVLPGGKRLTSAAVSISSAGLESAINLNFDLDRNGKEVALVAENVSPIEILGHPGSQDILAGRVLDPQGQAVPGAEVRLTNEATGLTYAAFTNDEGDYKIAAPVGNYRVEMDATGFARYEYTNVTIAENQVNTLDVNLNVGTLGSTVTVSAGGEALVDTSVSLDRLPLDGRMAANLFMLTDPLIDRRSTSGSSINGASGQEARFVMDGINTRDTLASSAESRESLSAAGELRVSQTGYQNPQLSNLSALQIDITTKSGTTTFHGGVNYQFMNEALDGHNFFSLPGFDVFRKHVGSAGLGGPISNAKQIFFFFNYELDRKLHSPAFSSLLTSQLPTLNQQLTRLGLKTENLRRLVTKFSSDSPTLRIDYGPTIRDSFLLQYGFRHDLTRGDLTSGFGGTSSAPSTGRDVDGRSHYLILRYNRVLSPYTTSESFYRYGSNSVSVFPLEPQQPSILIPGLVLLGRATNLIEGDGHRQTRHIVSEGIDLVLGRHRINFGGQFLWNTNTFRFAAFDSGRVIVPSLAALSATIPIVDLFQLGRGESSVRFKIPKLALYFRDLIQLNSRFSLTLGGQYKAEFPPSPQGNDVNGWQPNAGFAWDVQGDQTLILRANYGWYRADLPPLPLAFQRLTSGQGLQTIAPARRVISITGQQAASNAFNLFLNGDSVPNSPQLATIYDRKASGPSVQALDIGLVKSLGRNMALEILYAYRRGSNLLTSRNVNLPPPVFINGRPDFNGSSLNPNFAQIYQFETTGNSSYHGGSVRIFRNLSKGLTFDATYTFSKAVDDVPLLRTIDLPPSGSFESTPENNFARQNERALSDWSPAHRFHSSAIWEVPKPDYKKAGTIRRAVGTMFFSQAVRIESGHYFNVIVGSDANHDGNPLTDRPLNVARNTFLGQSLIQLDARVGSKINLTENQHLSLSIQVYNLLNRTNFSSYNTVLGQADLSGLDPKITSGKRGMAGFDFRHPLTPSGFGLATGAFEPRRIQLEVSFQF